MSFDQQVTRAASFPGRLEDRPWERQVAIGCENEQHVERCK